jgi:DMSO reductase anchor subunit
LVIADSDSGVDTNSLETAATRASDLGRTIAVSLIGLALAVASVILVFRRDFKEAIGLLVVGVIAVLLASPVGLSVLQDTVSTLFGSG